MADFLSRKERSIRMGLIRSTRNESTEERMAALMRRGKISGWRRGAKLPGRPDFVFRRQRLALFIDGCFWHGCPDHFRLPRTRTPFWRRKIDANQARDLRVVAELRLLGWRSLRAWEHELTTTRSLALLRKLRRHLRLGPLKGPPGRRDGHLRTQTVLLQSALTD